MDDRQSVSAGGEAAAASATVGDAKNERPLVTFALFAYNQERYIREAVEGAFSQTYEPLEIILSDDCSTDRTFEIMQEMAAAYRGPHKIVVRKNVENCGVLRHVRGVAWQANGEYFVLAAGDDISHSNRVTRLMPAFVEGADGLTSNYDLISGAGAVIATNSSPVGDTRSRLPWLRNNIPAIFIYGATSAYRTSIVRQLPETVRRVMSEDTPLNLLFQLCGYSATHIPESLVQYRTHENSISTSARPPKNIRQIIYFDDLDQNNALLHVDMLEYMIEISNIAKHHDAINVDEIRRDIIFHNTKYNWRKYSLLQKLGTISECRGWQSIRWCSLRVLGPVPLAVLKWVFYPWIFGTHRLK